MEKNIRKSLLIDNIDHAFVNARSWCSAHENSSFQLMINTETAEIWADYFISKNAKIYDTNSIKKLNTPYNYPHIMLARYAKKAINLLQQAEWNII